MAWSGTPLIYSIVKANCFDCGLENRQWICGACIKTVYFIATVIHQVKVLPLYSRWMLVLNSLPIMYKQFILITSQTSVTITFVAFNLLVLLLWQWKCNITFVTYAFVICLICMLLALGLQVYIPSKSFMPMLTAVILMC